MLIKAILIGIIQGLTAFLPVSSSGHSMLLYAALHIETASPVAFLSAGHLGSLVAVLLFFKRELLQVVAQIFQLPGLLKRNARERFAQIQEGTITPYQRLFTTNYGKITCLCLVGNIPTVLWGIYFHDLAKQLAENTLAIGIGCLFSAIFLLVASLLPSGKKLPQDLMLWQILVAGICQGAAVFPGVSRFAITLSVFLLLGQTKKSSIICSMLMSVPILAGSFFYTVGELFANGFSGMVAASVVICIVVSAVIGCLVIRPCIRFVQTHKLTIFCVYSFCMAVLCIGYHLVLK